MHSKITKFHFYYNRESFFYWKNTSLKILSNKLMEKLDFSKRAPNLPLGKKVSFCLQLELSGKNV